MAPRLFLGTDDEGLMAAVDRDHDNVRAVIDWGMTPEGRIDVALRAGVALHWYWFFRGQMLEGWRRIDAAIDLAKTKTPADPLEPARAMVALGLFSVVRGEPQHDSGRIAEAVALLQGASEPAELAYALAIQAAISSTSNPQEGVAAAEAALALLEGRPDTVLKGFGYFWKGVNCSALMKVEEARAASNRAVAIGRNLGHQAAIAHSTFVLALIEFMAGDLELARCWLSESLPVHARMSNQYGLSQGLRLGGHIAAQKGRLAEALQLFGAAERVREELGTPLPAAEQAALEECLNALRAHLGDEESAALMKQGMVLELGRSIALALEIGSPAAAPPAAVPAAPARPAIEAPAGMPTTALPPVVAPVVVPLVTAGALRVSSLGGLRVAVAGQPILEAAGAVRTRELLMFLLLSPEGVSKDEVGLALWPEASASQVRNSFHVTLHRLRGALGEAEAIRAHGNRYSVDPAFIGSFDVAQFEAKVAAGELEAAIELYGGELLEGESAGEWHLERRDRLQQLYLEALEVAGRQLREAGRMAEAAEVYRRWIVADDLGEEAYRQRMCCLEATGEVQEALRLYRKLVKVLERELGVEPEPATRAIYEKLLARSS